MNKKTVVILLSILIILLVSFVVFARTFVFNVVCGRVHFPEEYMGLDLKMEDGKKFTVLRRLQVEGRNNSAEGYAVFKVRFKFKSLKFETNKRLSMIPAPFLMGMKGAKVGAVSVSIIDDGRMKRGLSSSLCDDEGVFTKKLNVINKGVLENILYDTYTASKDGVQSTGNASRVSYKSVPFPGTSNFYISSGNKSKDEIIKGINIYRFNSFNLFSGTKLTYNISILLFIKTIFFGLKSDIIHFHGYPRFVSDIIPLIKLFTKKPIIFTLHGPLISNDFFNLDLLKK